MAARSSAKGLEAFGLFMDALGEAAERDGGDGFPFPLAGRDGCGAWREAGKAAIRQARGQDALGYAMEHAWARWFGACIKREAERMAWDCRADGREAREGGTA